MIDNELAIAIIGRWLYRLTGRPYQTKSLSTPVGELFSKGETLGTITDRKRFEAVKEFSENPDFDGYAYLKEIASAKPTTSWKGDGRTPEMLDDVVVALGDIGYTAFRKKSFYSDNLRNDVTDLLDRGWSPDDLYGAVGPVEGEEGTDNLTSWLKYAVREWGYPEAEDDAPWNGKSEPEPENDGSEEAEDESYIAPVAISLAEDGPEDDIPDPDDAPEEEGTKAEETFEPDEKPKAERPSFALYEWLSPDAPEAYAHFRKRIMNRAVSVLPVSVLYRLSLACDAENLPTMEAAKAVVAAALEGTLEDNGNTREFCKATLSELEKEAYGEKLLKPSMLSQADPMEILTGDWRDILSRHGDAKAVSLAKLRLLAGSDSTMQELLDLIGNTI